MTVGRLLREMSALELAEWAAHFRLRARESKRDTLAARSQAGLSEARRKAKGA